MSNTIMPVSSCEPIAQHEGSTLYEVINYAQERVYLTFNKRNLKKLQLGLTTDSLLDYKLGIWDRKKFLKNILPTIL